MDAPVDEALQRKLGIAPAASVALVSAPSGFAARLGLGARNPLRAHNEIVIAFFASRAELEAARERLGEAIYPAGALYCAWRKRASGRSGELSDTVVREVMLANGLVDTKVCSIDETWSALKFVWRRPLRATGAPPIHGSSTPAS